jgi:hypothetical protein
MNENNPEMATIEETVFLLDPEKLEELDDDFQQTLFEPHTADPLSSKGKYTYKLIWRIRFILLPLLVGFITLVAWTNYQVPHCEFQSHYLWPFH